MFNKILSIGYIAFKEALRRRILYIFVLAAIAIILSSHFFNFLAPFEEVKITKDMGLASILFFGVLIAIFATGELIPREIERKTVFTILSKPVKRFEFVLGKFFGANLVILLNFLLMSLVFLIMIFLKESFISVSVIKALILTYLELMVLSSIAICLSTISITTTFIVTVSFFIYIVGHLTDYLIHIAEKLESVFLSIFFSLIYTILPNFNNFNVRDKVIEGFAVPNLYMFKVTGYALIYTMVMLGFSYLFFSNREF